MCTKRDKWVRRFSVDETAKHKNGFTVYKITSVLFPLESPEAVTVVSVWKRYSDVQKLHKSMKSLHSGLHLAGSFPSLVSGGYFKRFQQETIGERAKSIKALLEFIAEHRLLFTSTDFVTFLQSGYPAPRAADSHNSHNTHTHTLAAHTHTHTAASSPREDDDSDSFSRSLRSPLPPPLIPPPAEASHPPPSRDETDFTRIPIHEPFDVERPPPAPAPAPRAASLESLASIESLGNDLFDELHKMSVTAAPSVKSKPRLPDLIDFDAPSTSRLDDIHMTRDAETVSLNSTLYDSTISEVDSRGSKLSSYRNDRSMLSLSAIDSKTRTEDSYVFEAGYLLNLAARSEDIMDYQKAFDYYKAGIEKMLIGVQTDPDSHRRALIKKKTNKYLSYAENIYKNHLCTQIPEPIRPPRPPPALQPPPAAMLRAPRSALALYSLAAVLHPRVTLVLNKDTQRCYAMKVIQKIPHNLTEFDEYFLAHTQETRQPLLPTGVPYMVRLHSYIETNNLVFLVLEHAPGRPLVDYIRGYEAGPGGERRVDLENVFPEPRARGDRDPPVTVTVSDDGAAAVNQLVRNSKRLLLDVDMALHDVTHREGGAAQGEEGGTVQGIESFGCGRRIPESAVCAWGAEILTAIDGLHNCGVICRVLSPEDVLLSAGGHALLTYRAGYSDRDVATHTHARAQAHARTRVYLAPELYHIRWKECEDDDKCREQVCDYWSFGAIMYQLICGVPLWRVHSSFSSHTLLWLPDHLSLHQHSLLTQLLTYDPRARLGAGGVNEIREHPYFRHVNWEQVYSTWERLVTQQT